MQYHLDGFKAGNPYIQNEASETGNLDEDEVDVLIVGCGPAGLTLAAQLAAFADIRTRIIERKDGPLELGQADGLACRTLEMFEAFGFSERVIREAYNVVETLFWGPDENNPDCIVRTGRIQDVEDDLSEMPHLILNQARVHDMYLQVMQQSARRLQPDYGLSLVELDDSVNKDFVLAYLETAQGHAETVKARYVVGCDGARSTVRQSMGLALTGDSANHAWGVMDVLLVTDFPDIRYKSVVRSASSGNVLIIPREGGYLVRFYIELGQLEPGERASARKTDSADLIKVAQRIFHPYVLEIKQVVWWSVYEIGQRRCNQFDNGSPATLDNVRQPRVFITGDACHTHSPKAGQGMNVAMADSFNLGWKLASVLRGHSQAQVLHSYSTERQSVAKELIEFDRHWAARFSESSDNADNTTSHEIPQKGVADFQAYFTDHGRYTAGVAVKYPQSILVANNQYQSLATGWTVGMRFHSAWVTRLADALPVQLAHTIKADGRWRLFAFASHQEPSNHVSLIWQLCDYLSTDPASPMRQYQKAQDDPDAMIDFRVIFQQSHKEISLTELHPCLLPLKGALGLQDTQKVFSGKTNNQPDIFDKRGVSRNGCMVLIRPDQYIADVMPLNATARLSAFCSQIFIPQQSGDTIRN